MFCACDFLFVTDLATQSSKRRKIVTDSNLFNQLFFSVGRKSHF